MNWSAVGAVAMAIGVAAGAFGAHALKGRLDAYSMTVYEKAVFYHFIHALGLLIVPLLPRLDLPGLYGPFSISVSLLLWAYVSGLLLFAGAQFSAMRHNNRKPPRSVSRAI